VGEGGPPLPGAVHPDAEVEAVGRLPGERLAGLGVQPVGDCCGQGPGKDRQAGGDCSQHGGAGGCLVVWVTGDAGVVEDEQAVWPVADSQPYGMGGQLRRRDAGEPIVGIAEQGNAGCGQLGAGVPQFRFAFGVQVGAVLVQRRRLAVGVAQDVRGSTCGRHVADDRAEPEGLVVGVRHDH
jgi:hypothetical protein